MHCYHYYPPYQCLGRYYLNHLFFEEKFLSVTYKKRMFRKCHHPEMSGKCSENTPKHEHFVTFECPENVLMKSFFTESFK